MDVIINEIALSDQSIVFYDDNYPKLRIGDDLIAINETSLPENGWEIVEIFPKGNKLGHFSTLATSKNGGVFCVCYEKEGCEIRFGFDWAGYPPMVVYVLKDEEWLFKSSNVNILKRYGLI